MKQLIITNNPQIAEYIERKHDDSNNSTDAKDIKLIFCATRPSELEAAKSCNVWKYSAAQATVPQYAANGRNRTGHPIFAAVGAGYGAGKPH